MKHWLSIAALTLLFISAQAQDFLRADTIIYHQNADGSYDVIAGSVFRKVTPENKTKIEKERIKLQLNDLADLERRVSEQRKKVQADSAALERNLENSNPNDLFADDVQSLVGVWKLTIADKSDEITVDTTGAFKSKKSGPGQLTVLAEGAKKIRIVFGE